MEKNNTLNSSQDFAALKLFLQTLACIAVLLVLVGVWGWYCYGNITDSIAYLKGNVISVCSPHRNVGNVKAGSEVVCEFKVRNLTGSEIRILGAKTECQCTVVSDLPTSLAPRQYHVLQTKLLLPKDVDLGPFEHTLLLYLNEDSQSVILTLRGTVVNL